MSQIEEKQKTDIEKFKIQNFNKLLKLLTGGKNRYWEIQKFKLQELLKLLTGGNK